MGLTFTVPRIDLANDQAFTFYLIQKLYFYGKKSEKDELLAPFSNEKFPSF